MIRLLGISAIKFRYTMAGQHWDKIICICDPSEISQVEHAWVETIARSWLNPGGEIIWIT